MYVAVSIKTTYRCKPFKRLTIPWGGWLPYRELNPNGDTITNENVPLQKTPKTTKIVVPQMEKSNWTKLKIRLQIKINFKKPR